VGISPDSGRTGKSRSCGSTDIRSCWRWSASVPLSRLTFARRLPRFSLFGDHLRTVLAVKGSLRRAQPRRALDSFGPFCSKPSYQEGKAQHGTGTHGAAILVPFSPPPTYDRRDPPAEWRRTCTGAEPQNQLEGIPDTNIEISSWRRISLPLRSGRVRVCGDSSCCSSSNYRPDESRSAESHLWQTDSG
jgi:hypothetical protein